MIGRVIVLLLITLLSNANAVSNCGSSTKFIYESGTYLGYSYSSGQACIACANPSSTYIPISGIQTPQSYSCYPSGGGSTITTGRCCGCPDGTGPFASSNYGDISTDWTQSSLCAKCPAGSYGSSEAYVRGGTCSSANAGCTACPPGKYQPDAGQKSCLSCPSDRRYTFARGRLEIQTGPNSYGYGTTIGATSLADCLALPEGYASSTVNNSCSNGGYDYPMGTYTYATACTLQFQVTTSGALSDCAYCPAGKVFFSQTTNFVQTEGISSTNYIKVYGGNDVYGYGARQSLTGMPPSIISASVSISRYVPYGASCVTTCPDGYELGPYEQTRACDPCNTYSTYVGFSPSVKYGAGGKCDVCPFNSYASKPAATSCTLCPYPWTGMNTASPYSKPIVCSPFNSPLCLCLEAGSVAAICLCIAPFTASSSRFSSAAGRSTSPPAPERSLSLCPLARKRPRRTRCKRPRKLPRQRRTTRPWT